MVKTLEELLKEEEVKTKDVIITLTPEEASRMLRVADRAIKRSAWVLKNISKYQEDKRSQIEKRATKSAKFWESIARKIESASE